MPNAPDGSVLGDDCKFYYSATLGGSGTLTEVPVIIEDSITRERRTAESNCRGDAEISTHVGKGKNAISGMLLLKRGTPGATFAALKSAYLANTLLHFALATGTITDVGQHVMRMEGRFSKFEDARPDGDVLKVSFEIVRSPDSAYATTESVVSGA